MMRSHPDRYPIGPRHEYQPYVEAKERWQATVRLEDYQAMISAMHDWDRESLVVLAPKICAVLRGNGGPMTLTELKKAYPPVREHMGHYFTPGFPLELTGLRLCRIPGRYGWQMELAE